MFLVLFFFFGMLNLVDLMFNLLMCFVNKLVASVGYA
jgi:hypothetical protein